MKQQWLKRSGTDDLLLVFGGWGIGIAPFKGINGPQDVLFIDDYRGLDTISAINDYAHVSLLAWSFGVAAATHWITQTGAKPDCLVAVNGTFWPADATRGIAPDVVEATASGLNTANFTKFCRRAGYRGDIPWQNHDTARDELGAIVKRGPAPEIAFDRVWISERDRIIPPTAQKTAWSSQNHAIRHINSTHTPFAAGQTWQGWLT